VKQIRKKLPYIEQYFRKKLDSLSIVISSSMTEEFALALSFEAPHMHYTNRSIPRNTSQPGSKLQHNKDFFL
jgi:hypothetical protein